MTSLYPSDFRTKLKGTGVLLGTGMPAPMPNIAAQTYSAGPDWVWIDTEHSPWGLETVYPILIQARLAKVAPIVRVPWNEPGIIKRTYDAGAVGVMIPQVDTPKEAADAVASSKYPPLGSRGIAPWFGNILGVSVTEIVMNANSETVLALQMESVEAWEQVDEILETPGFEVMIVGPADLSASYGGHGDVHFGKVEQIMSDLVPKARKAGKVLGTTFADPTDCRRWLKEGYRMMNVSTPMDLGTITLTKIFRELRDEFD